MQFHKFSFFSSVPVNPFKTMEDSGEVLQEKISFSHIYNSRAKELMAKRGRVSFIVLPVGYNYSITNTKIVFEFNRFLIVSDGLFFSFIS